MRFILPVLSAFLLVFLPSPLKAETAPVSRCMLEPDEEALVPAQEAGVLKKILVHEGDQVSGDQLLAQIDDAIPLAQRDVAYYKLQAATKKSEDDIDIRFAKMAAKVAKVEYDEAEDANRKVPGTVTHSEELRRLLDWHKMELSAEKSTKDQLVAKMEAKMAEGELRTAEENIKRRRIVAPIWFDRAGKPLDAVVVELTQHVGQWVQIGEPVLRLVCMDRLRVNGSLKAEEHRPSEIQGCDAEITVTLPHLGRLTFPGKIVYVKPVVEGGYLQVRAEVENRKQNGVWILNPGMNVEMTVQLK